MQVSKIIILLIGLFYINSCISQKTVIPSDIDINKNRLIYRNEQEKSGPMIDLEHITILRLKIPLDILQ